MLHFFNILIFYIRNVFQVIYTFQIEKMANNLARLNEMCQRLDVVPTFVIDRNFSEGYFTADLFVPGFNIYQGL